MLELAVLPAGLSYIPVLIAVALVIIIGYIGRAIFNRTKIPEALILIAIGILLGHLLSGSYTATLRSLAGIFGDIALVVIMYNGGRSIAVNKGFFRSTSGLSLGFLDTLLPTIFLSLLMKFVFGWPFVYGALLGAILGETSTVIVVPLIRKIKMPPEMYGSLLLETTLNSVFAILFFTLLLSFTNGQALSASVFANFALDYVSVSIVLGLVVGVLWLLVQSYIRVAREYLATLAIAILLFGVVTLFNGAAAISVLIFAIMVGNYKLIAGALGINLDVKKREIRERNVIERDIEFLIITFFFVFIGMIALLSIQYLLYAALVTALLVAIRYFETKYILDGTKAHRDLGFALMQRGTVVAVLAALLFSIGGLYFDQIFYICFMVIILTNIIGSVLLSRTEIELKKPSA